MLPRKYQSIIITFAVIILAVILYRSFIPHGGPGMQQDMGGASPVSVATVIEREIQEWNEFSGKLVAVDKVAIRPRVSGVIESVHFQDGAMVAKGDLLFVIDTRPFTAELNRAQAAVASANAAYSLAESEFARAQRLYKDKAIVQREYEERKNSANIAKANVESSQALLETARLNLEYTQVTSPIAGKIGRAEITVGNLVELGSNAPILTNVVANNPIYTDFEIDEDNFLKYSNTAVNNSQEAQQIPVIMTVGNENSATYEGFVQSFDNSLDAQSGTIRARAVFENQDGRLVPGLFARIKLGNAEKKPAILITDRAVGTDQNKKFVYVIGANNQAEYREIQLGSKVDTLRVVRQGLAKGERIVVSGLQRVRPSAPVIPEMVDMESSTPLNTTPTQDPSTTPQ